MHAAKRRIFDPTHPRDMVELGHLRRSVAGVNAVYLQDVTRDDVKLGLGRHLSLSWNG